MVDGRWKVEGTENGKQKTESRNGAGFAGLRALAGRFHPELEGVPVKAWNLRALAQKRKIESRKQKAAVGQYAGFIEVGRVFACAVRDSLRKWRDLPGDTIIFAYDTGALEIFEWCQERGIRCVLDQIDPSRVEVGLVSEEEKRWPGWGIQRAEARDQPGEAVGGLHGPRKSEDGSQRSESVEEYFQRREREWELADRIIVNSEWSRKALVQQGVEPEKLVVVPLAFETNAEKQKTAQWSKEQTPRAEESRQRSEVRLPISDLRPLKVLFLGQVILRKGIQYLMEAARKLEKENIRFDVVGPIGISQEAVASAPSNMTFHGQAVRDRAGEWYQKADLFVLPTLSDGFGITQLEAMSYGLPVITTPCCGDVVSNGVDGFLVPPRDAEALVTTFRRYLAEPDLLKRQSPAALAKSKRFTIERLAANLMELESELTKCQPQMNTD